MNAPAKIILLVGLLAISMACAFPPWILTADAEGDGGGHIRKPAGCSFVFSPPAPERSDVHYGVVLDLERLTIEIIIIVATASAGLLVISLGKYSFPTFLVAAFVLGIGIEVNTGGLPLNAWLADALIGATILTVVAGKRT